MDHEVDLTIDAKGQKCPMPVLMTWRGSVAFTDRGGVVRVAR